MTEETRKFLYDEDQYEIGATEDIRDDNNINKSSRITDVSQSYIGTNSKNMDASPDINIRQKGLDMSPFNSSRRTAWNRTFGPMQQGSLRGSIFALCAVAIGAGVLSLPYVLKQNGWILGTILILIGAISGYFSMQMIIQRSIETNSKNFSELSHLAGGKPLTILLQISILSFMFGACVSYQIIITKLFVICCNNFGVSPEITGDPEHGITTFKAVQCVITTVCFIFPLSLAKSMSALRYVSIVSIGSILYTLIVMLVELPEYSAFYFNKDTFTYFSLNKEFFSGCSITFFSFTCQASILPIYSELVNPNERRMMKVIGRSLIIDSIFYCSIALVGYFSTYDATTDLVIARKLPGVDKDYAMTISCIAVIMVVLVSSPANYFPFKNTVNYMINGKGEVSTKLNVICTVIFCSCTCVLSIVFPKIHSALSITGGFSSVNMCYLVPCKFIPRSQLFMFKLVICYVKLSDKRWYQGRNLVYTIFFMTLSLIGWVSVVLTFVDIFQGNT
eukprot:403343202